MAEKTLKTRIALKTDTLANWGKSTLVLKKGELAIATIETANVAKGENPPCMFKVGDGEKTFSQLGWASALSADVYAWAKQSGITISTVGTDDSDCVKDIAWKSKTEDGKIVYYLEVTKGTSNNQRFKTENVGFGANDLVTIKGDTAVAVSADANAKTITISSPDVTITQTDEYKVDDKEELVTVIHSGNDLKATNHSITASYVKVPTVNYVKNRIGELTKFDIKVVASLPTTGVKGTIYLVPCDKHNPSDKDIYDEYIWVTRDDGTSVFEKIGNTDVNLDNYKTKQSAINTAAATSKTLTKITQNANGEITATFGDIAITQSQVSGLTTALDGKKSKQTEVSLTGGTAKTITAISQDEDGVVSATFGDIAFPTVNTGVMSVTADGGLKISNTDAKNPNVTIDDSITFILDCGGAS